MRISEGSHEMVSKPEKRVIPYAGIENKIIQAALIKGDNKELAHKLTTLKMEFINSLGHKLQTNKYDLSRSSAKEEYERDLHLYTLLNNIGYYESISLTGIPDTKDEKGDEASCECIEPTVYSYESEGHDFGSGKCKCHKMIQQMRNKLLKLVKLIYTQKKQNTMKKELFIDEWFEHYPLEVDNGK